MGRFMIVIHHTISLIIFLCVVLPLILLALPLLAVALLTDWSGKTLFFGNTTWGRATDHYRAPTENKYWKEFLWLGFRNTIYNFRKYTISVKVKPYTIEGDKLIGDKVKGGFYKVSMGLFWEYYFVKPYTIFNRRMCVRWRVGWKIVGNTERAEWVFSINPFRKYEGVA